MVQYNDFMNQKRLSGEKIDPIKTAGGLLRPITDNNNGITYNNRALPII